MALKLGILFELESDDQVTRGGPSDSGPTLAAKRQIVVLGHAGRDLDFDQFLGAPPALTHTIPARVIGHFPAAVASRTRVDRNEVTEERLCCLPDLPHPATGGARRH